MTEKNCPGKETGGRKSRGLDLQLPGTPQVGLFSVNQAGETLAVTKEESQVTRISERWPYNKAGRLMIVSVDRR